MRAHHSKDRWRLDSLIHADRADAFLAAHAVRTEEPEPLEADDPKRILAETLLDELTAEQREVVELVLMQQVSMVDAGEMLGLSDEAVRGRLRRAMARLRRAATRLA